jgi:hypothetical protein
MHTSNAELSRLLPVRRSALRVGVNDEHHERDESFWRSNKCHNGNAFFPVLLLCGTMSVVCLAITVVWKTAPYSMMHPEPPWLPKEYTAMHIRVGEQGDGGVWIDSGREWYSWHLRAFRFEVTAFLL